MQKARKPRYLTLSIAFILAITLTISPTKAYSVFPDVPDNASYVKEVNFLYEMGIFAGDNNGNFNPNQTMTRAEAATVMVKLFVTDGLTTPAQASFTDVPVSHWAFTWVETAVKYGIFSGYGNGLFGGNDELTYAQAVTLLVKGLGYQDMAEELGGFPYGYIEMGNQLGITQNTVNMGNNPVPRSTVAVLIYNACYSDYSDNEKEEDGKGLTEYAPIDEDWLQEEPEKE